MDVYEATRVVFSRIQNLDPENASKIMGLLLIQDHGEKEMIRLAFGPEALLHSVIIKARKELGLLSNTSSTPSTPSSPSPFNPLSLSRQSSSVSCVSSRLANNGGYTLPSPLAISNPSSASSPSWCSSVFPDFQNPDELISPSSSSASYLAAASNGINGSSSSSLNSNSAPFYGNSDFIDELQLQDQLSFLNDGSPYSQSDLSSSPSGDGMMFPNWGGTAMHRRSCSISDICFDDPNSGFGWKPCLYFARGYCKNGTSCRFLHGNDNSFVGSDPVALVGSPSKLEMMEQCQELLRSKSAQQQRLAAAAQLMVSSSSSASSPSSFPYPSPLAANKCMNFLFQQQQNDSQRAAAAALMMSEDLHKFGRSPRLERNEFAMNGGAGMVNPGSRQIYLTFPADSTFREEDVSNYFSIYGPVQDVRIPYQQKRMFGFVTFVYPETVKLILSKGNPHFVCDARVLVKPYKEKGKVPDKKQQQQAERGDFSACNSPTGLDARDPYDQLGARMFYNSQDMLWRRKLEEQADFQQALELQGRRLMGLQLLDVKKNHYQRNLSAGATLVSPTNHPPNIFNQGFVLPQDSTTPEISGENASAPATVDQNFPKVTKGSAEKESTGKDENGNGNANGKEISSPNEESELPESLEHNLPDSPFASPTKSAGGEYMSAFSNGSGEAEKSTVVSAAVSSANNNLITSSLLPATSALDIASFKSCYFQMPRFSSGHGAIGM
ncbi:RNA recognition motif domain [Dillenia turbinata]|uniref:RNA recognition motif domain n=1 Tax=Dillenia turbinata TaxID=194707 RepID=A0AAN8V750_9MAGN